MPLVTLANLRSIAAMGLLEVRGLFKAFAAIRAVDSVSFTVREGELYGLLGPNGAGKTTTISMIAGLLKPDAGEVIVAGTPFWSDPQRAKRIMGVVPQEVALYEELSGRENLEFWGRMAGLSAGEAKSRATELLEGLSLADRAKDALKNYSGGMKRRINLGCALLHRPKLLLLDEPTVGIDPQARLNILEFIRNLRSTGTAILYTTHYLEEAETLCDRVFVLEADFKDAAPDTWPGFHERFARPGANRLLPRRRQIRAGRESGRKPAGGDADVAGVRVGRRFVGRAGGFGNHRGRSRDRTVRAGEFAHGGAGRMLVAA